MTPIRPLPRDLQAEMDRRIKDCKNLGLILDKYQPWKESALPQGWSLQFQVKVRKTRNDQIFEELQILDKTNEVKGHWLSSANPPPRIRRVDVPLNPNSHLDPILYAAYFQRWRRMVSGLGGILLPMKNVSRVVIGLGSKGTLEMGLTLHHHAGYPWIPGSALKGLAHSYAVYWLANSWRIPAVDNAEFIQRRKDGKASPLQMFRDLFDVHIGPGDDPQHRLDLFSDKLRRLQEDPLVIAAGSKILQVRPEVIEGNKAFRIIRSVFGNQDNAGAIIFFGGMTNTVPALVTEIMTPHYNAYYQGTDFPLDNDKPVPNVFLALETNQIFYFGLAPRRPDVDPALMDAAKDYLTRGLQEFGIGAKTNSGMGLFQPVGEAA